MAAKLPNPESGLLYESGKDTDTIIVSQVPQIRIDVSNVLSEQIRSAARLCAMARLVVTDNNWSLHCLAVIMGGDPYVNSVEDGCGS